MNPGKESPGPSLPPGPSTSSRFSSCDTRASELLQSEVPGHSFLGDTLRCTFKGSGWVPTPRPLALETPHSRGRDQDTGPDPLLQGADPLSTHTRQPPNSWQAWFAREPGEWKHVLSSQTCSVYARSLLGLAGPRRAGGEVGRSSGQQGHPRICTHVSQQEGIRLVVVSVKQKTQGLPRKLGAGKSHGSSQDRTPLAPAMCWATHPLPPFPQLANLTLVYRRSHPFHASHEDSRTASPLYFATAHPEHDGKVREGRDVTAGVGVVPLRLLGLARSPGPGRKAGKGICWAALRGPAGPKPKRAHHSHLLMVCLTGLSCRWTR